MANYVSGLNWFCLLTRIIFHNLLLSFLNFVLFLFVCACVFILVGKKKRYEVKVHVYEGSIYKDVERGRLFIKRDGMPPFLIGRTEELHIFNSKE